MNDPHPPREGPARPTAAAQEESRTADDLGRASASAPLGASGPVEQTGPRGAAGPTGPADPSAKPYPAYELPIEWLPVQGVPEQLLLLLHDAGGSATDLLPLAQALRAEFPQAAVLAPQLSAAQAAQDNDALDSAAAQAWLLWLRAQQARLRVGAPATAIAGLGQGARRALATVQAHDGLVGRVLALDGSYARAPASVPQHTTLHFFLADASGALPAEALKATIEQLAALNADATLDIAQQVAQPLHPALLQRVIFRLRNHIPARTWRAALGAARAAAEADEAAQANQANQASQAGPTNPPADDSGGLPPAPQP